MDELSNFEGLESDVIHTSKNILKNFEASTITGSFPDFCFSEFGQKFSLEIDLSRTSAVIKTFHLIRDKFVFGQYNKVEVKGSVIGVTMNKDGQVKYQFNNSAVEIMPDDFNKSHLKKHYKAVSDFVTEIKL